MRWSLIAVGIYLLLPRMAGAAEVSSAATDAMRRALSSSAEWTMTRRLGESGRTLKSSGTVDCVAKSAIVWRVTAPFESTVTMTTNAMIFADEEGVRTKPLEELPHYAEIRAKTDAFVAGDAKAFDGLFEIDSSGVDSGGWRVTLKPEVSAMRQLFVEIELTGSALPTNAILKTADGGSCQIDFRPQRR